MSYSCPVHGPGKVRTGTKGNKYCATKVGEGWCTAKPVDVSAQLSGDTSFVSSVGNGSALAAGHDTILQAAALNFAGQLCRYAGSEMADDAIAIAVRAFSAMKAAQ